MAIDVAALRKISEGDPSSKVAVTRRWLSEICKQIEAGEAAKAELGRQREGAGMYEMLFGGGRR